MTKQLVTLLVVLFASVGVAQPQDQRTFTKDTRFHRFHSEVMAQERSMLVIVPPDYDEATKTRYPVLYMHDGQSVFVSWRIDEIVPTLVAAKQIEPIIVVAIFNGDSQEARFSDYTPTRDARFAKSGNADAYGRMIVQELKPIVDAEYRTLPDRDDTGIGGTSLGGLVTLYLALRHHAIFGKAAVMSPSVWWDKQVILREVRAIGSKPLLKLWLDIGNEESRQSIADTKVLRDALLKKGWNGETDLKYFEGKGAAHNEKGFASRAPEMLRYLFPARKP